MDADWASHSFLKIKHFNKQVRLTVASDSEQAAAFSTLKQALTHLAAFGFQTGDQSQAV